MNCKKEKVRKKNINCDNGGTLIRVTKTRSKHIAEKEEEKESLSDEKRKDDSARDGTKSTCEKKRSVSVQKR